MGEGDDDDGEGGGGTGVEEVLNKRGVFIEGKGGLIIVDSDRIMVDEGMTREPNAEEADTCVLIRLNPIIIEGLGETINN